ncbi:hypothetical protein C8J57DRAFT_1532510 [Mycena rebaudengoi]|nr:hypothetical protein C8J57DRAFT_1532510 [Mycena rebaudengoi]
MIKDFIDWKRRVLTTDEDWQVFDQLYHHVVVEDMATKTTFVIFAHYLPKPHAKCLGADNRFLDEEIPQQDASKIREIYKGRCAPLPGKIFDLVTGVERIRPYNSDSPDSVSQYEEEKFLVSLPEGLGSRSLRGRQGIRDKPEEYDSTFFRRSVGPRYTSPYSDHSLERRVEDSAQPMAYVSRWVQWMSGDNVGNYCVNQCLPHPPPISDLRSVVMRSPSLPFMDARSVVSSRSVLLSRQNSVRRLASPVHRSREVHHQRTPPPSQRGPPIFQLCKARFCGMRTGSMT